MTDLIERLRHFGAKQASEPARGCIGSYIELCNEAATLLERQGAEIEALRANVIHTAGQMAEHVKARSRQAALLAEARAVLPELIRGMEYYVRQGSEYEYIYRPNIARARSVLKSLEAEGE